jgi:laminin alpha 3/5
VSPYQLIVKPILILYLFLDDYCKPCSCSGNIDSTDPSSCDTVTGACLRCMNNTGGAACELCAAGFFGDALLSKNCKKCDCAECGTHQCDNTFGDCKCLNNVVGVGCSKCRDDYYGLGRCDGQGCHYCDCGIASASSQCDDMTGQCECKKGTTGRRCERCAPGYWNYTEDGCQCNFIL